MDEGKKASSLKLFGASSSYPCSTGFCKRREGLNHSHSDGQCHCSGLCEPHGRDKVPTTSHPGLKPLGMVLTVQIVSVSFPPSGSRQCEGGPPVKDSCRQTQLETEASDVSENTEPVGAFQSGSVCFHDLLSSPEIFQLEARSISRSSGCLLPGLCLSRPGGWWGKCLQQVLQQGATIALITPLWPTQAWYPALFPLLFNYPEDQDLMISPGGETTPESQSVGLMVYLRRSYQNSGVSEGAITLLMASWRSSTTKNYNSSWRIWECWCAKSSTSSISLTIEDIANFLAAEF